MKTYRFIGGPMHGREKTVSQSNWHVDVPIYEPHIVAGPDGEDEVHLFRAMRYEPFQVTLTVMAPAHMDQMEKMTVLADYLACRPPTI